MKHIWSILCQNSSIDNESNLLSLFNCIEEISLEVDAAKAPKDNKIILPAEFQLVSFWIIDNEKEGNLLDLKVELIDPDKTILNQFGNIFPLKKGSLRFRNRINIQGLPITKAGRYTFKIYKKEQDKKDYEEISELPLDVKINYKMPGLNSLKEAKQ